MTDTAAALRGNWNYPTAVRFGPGRIAELPEACRAAGISRPLLVTDPGLAGLPMVKDAIARSEATSRSRQVGMDPRCTWPSTVTRVSAPVAEAIRSLR